MLGKRKRYGFSNALVQCQGASWLFVILPDNSLNCASDKFVFGDPSKVLVTGHLCPGLSAHFRASMEHVVAGMALDKWNSVE